MNDPAETARAATIARKAFGEEAVVYPGPSYLGSEDFAFMLQKKQGTYCLLGNGDTAMVHHPRYVFNDEILPMGAAYWVALTEQYLHLAKRAVAAARTWAIPMHGSHRARRFTP